MYLSAIIKKSPGEHELEMLRRHPITFLPYVLFFILLLAVPFILYTLIATLFPDFFANTTLQSIAIIFTSVYLLCIYIFFYTQFIAYYLDIWVITNERMIDVEQFGLFSRSVSELELSQIQDVTADVHGIFATFFNYGDVSIKTASSTASIIARQVPNPNHVRETLIKLADSDRRTHTHNPNPPAAPKV